MLRAIQKFLRLKILITCYTIVFISSAAVGGIYMKTVLAIAVIAAWYLHAVTANDYADRFIDEVNLSEANDRPLVSKDISIPRLWLLHASSGLLALILSSLYGKGALVPTCVILIFDYAYSFKPMRISDRGIISQLTLPLAYVIYPFTLGYLSHPNPKQFPVLLLSGLYCGFIARLFLKDFRDVKGDKLHGKMTYLLRHGRKATCTISAVFSFVSFLLLLVSANFALGAGIILTISQFIGIHTLMSLSKTQKLPDQLQHIRHLARVANSAVVTILAHFLCQNQPELSMSERHLIPFAIGIALLAVNNLTCKARANQ